MTTYQNPVMYISVADNYKSSNNFMVEITSQNGNTTEKTVAGNGSEISRIFSLPGGI